MHDVSPCHHETPSAIENGNQVVLPKQPASPQPSAGVHQRCTARGTSISVKRIAQSGELSNRGKFVEITITTPADSKGRVNAITLQVERSRIEKLSEPIRWCSAAKSLESDLIDTLLRLHNNGSSLIVGRGQNAKISKSSVYGELLEGARLTNVRHVSFLGSAYVLSHSDKKSYSVIERRKQQKQQEEVASTIPLSAPPILPQQEARPQPLSEPVPAQQPQAPKVTTHDKKAEPPAEDKPPLSQNDLAIHRLIALMEFAEMYPRRPEPEPKAEPRGFRRVVRALSNSVTFLLGTYGLVSSTIVGLAYNHHSKPWYGGEAGSVSGAMPPAAVRQAAPVAATSAQVTYIPQSQDALPHVNEQSLQTVAPEPTRTRDDLASLVKLRLPPIPRPESSDGLPEAPIEGDVSLTNISLFFK